MTRRELWKVIVFGIITLGIYDLYWLYRTRQEMAARGASIPPLKLLFVPVLALVAVALLQFVVRFALVTGGTSSDVLGKILNITTLLIGMAAVIAIIPVTIYWIYQYSKAVERVTAGKITFGFAFGLWWLLNFFSVGFVWPALIQDGFNKTPDPSAANDPTSAPTSENGQPTASSASTGL